MITAEIDEKLLNEVRKRLGDFQKKTPQAISSALNRAVSNVATNVGREIRQEYTIKSGDVEATLEKTRANKSNLSAIVRSKGELVPLDRFKVSPKTVQPRRKKPIKVGVKKGGLKTTLDAFVSDINGIKVFKRTTQKRLPIRRLFGPSVPQMLGNEEIIAKIDAAGSEMFLRRLDHEIDRILQRGMAKQ